MPKDRKNDRDNSFIDKEKNGVLKESKKKKCEIKLERILPKDIKHLEDFVKIGKSKARKEAILNIEFEKYSRKDYLHKDKLENSEDQEDDNVEKVISQFKQDENKAIVSYGDNESKNNQYEKKEDIISYDGFGYDKKEEPKQKPNEDYLARSVSYTRNQQEEYTREIKRSRDLKEKERKRRGY